MPLSGNVFMYVIVGLSIFYHCREYFGYVALLAYVLVFCDSVGGELFTA